MRQIYSFFIPNDKVTITYQDYRMALALGGLPTAPGTFKGDEVRKKLYFWAFLHSSASTLRSHSSPSGIPIRLKHQGWRTETLVQYDSQAPRNTQ